MLQVTLPIIVKSVTLPPIAAAVLQSIIDSGNAGITSRELAYKHSLTCVHNYLSLLRREGAVFDTSTMSYHIKGKGKRRGSKGIKRYVYKDWILK